MENAPAAGSSAAGSVVQPKYKPKIKEGKGNRQGEGKKRCGGCGKGEPFPEGACMHTGRHALFKAKQQARQAKQ